MSSVQCKEHDYALFIFKGDAFVKAEMCLISFTEFGNVVKIVVAVLRSLRTNLSPFTKGCRECDTSM